MVNAVAEALGLAPSHPVAILLEERERLVLKKRRCVETVENARANMIRHRAMAIEFDGNIKQVEEAIKSILPKLPKDAGSTDPEPTGEWLESLRQIGTLEGAS